MNEAQLLSELRAKVERDSIEHHRKTRFFLSVSELCLQHVSEGLKKNEAWAVSLATEISQLDP